MQGTMGFLAPEIVALKRWAVGSARKAPPSPYGRKVDVWALGLSAYVTYTGAVVANQCMTQDSYQMIHQDLEREIQINEDTVQVSLAKAILQMLCWDARNRLSAAQAVEAFQQFDKQMDENAMMNTGATGMKRPHNDAPSAAGGSPDRRNPRNRQTSQKPCSRISTSRSIWSQQFSTVTTVPCGVTGRATPSCKAWKS